MAGFNPYLVYGVTILTIEVVFATYHSIVHLRWCRSSFLNSLKDLSGVFSQRCLLLRLCDIH